MATQIQQAINTNLGAKATINPAEEIRERIDFMKAYLKNSGRDGFVLGISGGQDSSLAGKLAQLSVEELRAEGYKAKFVAMRLPYGMQKDEDDAQLALDFIVPDENIVFNIKDTVDAFKATFDMATNGEPLTDYDKGNVKARARMVAQYAVAGAQKLMVIESSNSAEIIQGFVTLGGDGLGDLAPITDLNKRQGKELLKELNAPARLYEKMPTADLLDEKPGQADEVELGMSYQTVDDFLEGKDVSTENHDQIVERFFKTEFKRHMPANVADTWWKQ